MNLLAQAGAPPPGPRGISIFPVFAQGGKVPTTPGELITRLLPNIIVVSGVIFFAVILYGGFMLITMAGGNASPQEGAKAKNTITYGFLGFLLVVSAYFILQILKVMTGVDLLNPPVT